MSNVYSVKSILISLIDSIDMYNFLLKKHHRRTAVIAYELGNMFGLEESRLCNLVLAASIHDIGALNMDDRDKLLYIDAINPEQHEIMGAKMLESFKPLDPIRKIIRHHHIKVSDIENGIVNEKDVPYECYFLHLADRIDVLLTTSTELLLREHVVEEINRRFGDVFLPELQDTFAALCVSQEFWENIDNSSFQELLFMSIRSGNCIIQDSDIDGLAEVFANIVDLKSHWTFSHSKSVSMLAQKIGTLYGLDKDTCHMLKIAGYLHDIGKIAIPIEILEKPTPLNYSEEKILKSHVTYSSLILSKTPFLGDICKWVSAHHEKRDKTGYPLHIGGSDFTIEIDILAYADIFSALSENRPNRNALPKSRMLSILEDFSVDKLSPEVFEIVKENFEYLYLENAKEQKAMSHLISKEAL